LLGASVSNLRDIRVVLFSKIPAVSIPQDHLLSKQDSNDIITKGRIFLKNMPIF
jgi:hypothetical protein